MTGFGSVSHWSQKHLLCVSEPTSVELNIDGSKDQCSRGEDINFQFTGFGLTGRVSGVNRHLNKTFVYINCLRVCITLISSGKNKPERSAHTGAFCEKLAHPSENTLFWQVKSGTRLSPRVHLLVVLKVISHRVILHYFFSVIAASHLHEGSYSSISLVVKTNARFAFQVVSSGQSEGPKGVKLELTKKGSKDVVKSAETKESGDFVFERVLPGDYLVTAFHESWEFDNVSL